MATPFPVSDFSFHLIVLTFWEAFLALYVNYNENSLKASIKALAMQK